MNRTVINKVMLWIIGISVVIIIGVTALGSGSDDEAQEDDTKAAAEETTTDKQDTNESEDDEQDNNESKDDAVLNDDDLNEIKDDTNEFLNEENEEPYGDFQFNLDDFDYDKEENNLSMIIVVEDDPLPKQKEVKEYTQDVAWNAGLVMTDKDYTVTVSSALKIDENEYGLFGRANFSNNDTEFTEEESLSVLDK